MQKNNNDLFLFKGLLALASIVIWVFVLPEKIKNFEPGATTWFISLLLFLSVVFFHDVFLNQFGFRKREFIPIKIWRPKAVLELKQTYDMDWSKYSFQAEAYEYELVPFGMIWVENKFNGELKGAFVNIVKGSNNLIVSKLDHKDWHLRSHNVKSLQDCAEIYLKGNNSDFKVKLTNEREDFSEVVST